MRLLRLPLSWSLPGTLPTRSIRLPKKREQRCIVGISIVRKEYLPIGKRKSPCHGAFDPFAGYSPAASTKPSEDKAQALE